MHYELPFFTLDSQEFLKITRGWVHQSFQSFIESKDLFADIITSPQRESELQEYNNYIQSLPSNSLENSFMRRPKNLTSLQDIIEWTVKWSPEIYSHIRNKTTRKKKNIYNIRIPDYVFFKYKFANKCRWCHPLYFSRIELHEATGRDVKLSDDGIESCWVEKNKRT